MRLRVKIAISTLLMLVITMMFSVTALADSVDDVGGTGQGDIGGTNVYTFSYIYDASDDAIKLKVDTKNPLSSFGNTTSHPVSAGDTTTLHTKNPRLGNSLENAIASMNAAGGYNLSVDYVKSALNAHGYYDKGNGIWITDGGYLTYISAVKVRPQTHTVTYNANGGSGAPGNQTKTQGVTLKLSSTKPTRTGYTFKYWNASIGGTYSPGGNYTHDQNGGTVTMTAYWKDETAPSCSSFSAIPNSWSSGNGTASFSAQDKGTGMASIVLKRYSYVTQTWSDVKSWSYSGTTGVVTGTYTETAEGVFYYKIVLKDKAGNTSEKTSSVVYLDHSKPVISGLSNTTTTWTNTAPVISVSATDYLSGTSYNGSGLSSIVIKNDAGTVVASGTSSASYTLKASDEGVHTWTVVATDGVGWQSSGTVSTKFDITAPGIDGRETTLVHNGETYSGYCEDNIIDQSIDDKKWRSDNSPNQTSGLKSVILYRVVGTNKTVIYGDTTKATFSASDTNSSFDMYYEIDADEKEVAYYLIVVSDHAGNVAKKKLISQYSLLTWFHTSIERSTYR